MDIFSVVLIIDISVVNFVFLMAMTVMSITVF